MRILMAALFPVVVIDDTSTEIPKPARAVRFGIKVVVIHWNE